MKKMIMAAGIAVALSACNSSEKKSETTAPGDIFLTEFTTPFGVPPFDKITLEDYMPAFKAGIAEQQAEVAAITNQPEAPDFENTIVALDQSGETLVAALQSVDCAHRQLEAVRIAEVL